MVIGWGKGGLPGGGKGRGLKGGARVGAGGVQGGGVKGGWKGGGRVLLSQNQTSLGTNDFTCTHLAVMQFCLASLSTERHECCGLCGCIGAVAA